MSDPWAERHPHAGGLRGEDREQVLSFAEGYNAALATVRPDYDAVCAERDAAMARAERAEADADRLYKKLRYVDGTQIDNLADYNRILVAHDAAVAQRGGDQ